MLDLRRGFQRPILLGWFLALAFADLSRAAPSPARILLVDDDFSDNNNSSGKGALSNSDQVYRRLVKEVADTTGGSWDVTVVDRYSDGPSLEHLRGYSLVVWYTGASYGGNSDNRAVLSLNDEASLIGYLAQNSGAMVVISPGYVSKVLASQGWDQATWPFLKSVLSVKGGYGFVQRFLPGTITSAEGKAYLIDAPGSPETQFSVVNPDQAETVFTFTMAKPPLENRPAPVAIAQKFGRGKIVYAGFTLENLPATSATTVFQRLLTAAGVDLTARGAGAAATLPPPAAPPAFKLAELNQVLNPSAVALAHRETGSPAVTNPATAKTPDQPTRAPQP